MASIPDPARLAYWRDQIKQNPKLLSQTYPRINKYIQEAPTPKQAAFLLMPTLEGFYGGAARGGKTSALLTAALQYVDIPGYNALLLRRTYGQLNMPDSILTRAHQWLRRTDARWNAMHYRYEFPSGAMLQFGYLQYFNDVYQYDGTTLQFIGWDELTQFLEPQYRFLFSRLNRLKGSSIPLRMRSASNPGGLGHNWVKERFIRYQKPDRFFIPATLDDNPHIDADSYRLSLSQLDIITRRQREYGDWDITREGAIFKREWFETFVDRAPDGLRRVRFWDLAATAPKPGKDPDYVVGTLVGADRKSGRVFIEDVRRARLSPYGVEDLIVKTAQADGRQVKVRIEQEPGASGKIVVADFGRKMIGYDVVGVTSTGPKITRWMPLAAHSEKGLVTIINGPWNHDWFEEITAVPENDHDDQADSASGAFNCLIDEVIPQYGVSFLGSKK